MDDVEGPDSDSTLARAIIDLGQSFRLKVVAEGIEREDQRIRLLELGCRLGQGFHFTRPLERAEMDALLDDRRIPWPVCAPPPSSSSSP